MPLPPTPPVPPAPDALALIASLLALGVHVTTAVVLVAVAWGNARVRTYLVFLAVLTTWLATLALHAGGWAPRAALVVGALAAHVLPLVYLAYALELALPAGTVGRLRVALAVAGVALLPVGCGLWRVAGAAGVALYHAVLWTTGAALLAHRARASAAPELPPELSRARTVITRVLSLVALVNVVVILVDPGHYLERVVPLVASVAQLLVVVGAVRYQFYGVARAAERTGAARTGALAREAAELERLALLGELGATVAHEVRNPLTGIRSLAQRLAGGEEVDAARRARFAALIVSEVDRLDRFVGSMLALARREEHAAREGASADGAVRDGARALGVTGEHARIAAAGVTALAPLLADLDALVSAHAARRGVRLALHAHAPAAAAPRGALAQVLLNLLLNAVEHSPDGATVTLDAAAAGAAVRLTVRDHGPGLSAAARETLFQPFAPGARGTGLGLAVVRRVAAAHGWEVTVHDAEGGGTAFVVAVPAPADPVGASPLASPALLASTTVPA